MIWNSDLFYSYEMNINDDYQKLRGQITSFPTGWIIEPNRKYLESNSFCPSLNLWYLREYLRIYRKVNRGKESA